MAMAMGAATAQWAHELEVGDAVSHHAVAQVTRGLVLGHTHGCARLRVSLIVPQWVLSSPAPLCETGGLGGLSSVGPTPASVLELSRGGKCLSQVAVGRNVRVEISWEHLPSYLGTVAELVMPETAVTPDIVIIQNPSTWPQTPLYFPPSGTLLSN